MNDSEDIFLKQMKGVSPIKKNNRIQKTKLTVNKNITNVNDNKKKQITTTNIKLESLEKKSEFILENLKIKKNIKKGSLKIDKKIDFHGKTLLESEECFSNEIIDSYSNGLRCLLFVTGKGLYKKKMYDDNNVPKLYHGIIRTAFIEWVKSKRFSKHILSFDSASVEHGGDGAFYVYLRKKKTNLL